MRLRYERVLETLRVEQSGVEQSEQAEFATRQGSCKENHEKEVACREQCLIGERPPAVGGEGRTPRLGIRSSVAIMLGSRGIGLCHHAR